MSCRRRRSNGLTYYANTLYDPETGKVGQVRNFGGFVLDYAYSPRGYLTAITDDASGLAYFTAVARNASLQLTRSTAGNGVTTTDSFDPLTGRMLNVCASNHAGSCDGAIANIATDFDAVGNLTTRGDTLHGVTETFGYDLLNRLTSTSLAFPRLGDALVRWRARARDAVLLARDGMDCPPRC
ncbi:MAG TPA: hypothetical protein VGF56_00705 [Rhizomicrobium sp.]